MGTLNFGSSEVIAALALVASIASLLISWRTGHHSTRITTYRSATDLTLDMDRVFVEHPDLRKYFYNGEDIVHQTEDTQARVESIAELMLDCFECIWDIRATYSVLDRGSWGQYVLDMLRTSPAMNRMFEERRKQDWYPSLADLKRAESQGRIDAQNVRIVRWVRRFLKVTVPSAQRVFKSEQESGS